MSVKSVFMLFSIFVVFSCIGKPSKEEKPSGLKSITKEAVTEIIKKVNGYWQSSHPKHGNAFWHPSAYHIGNLEAYKVTGIEAYKSYSLQWAEENQWMGAKSTNPQNWKYHYGETDDFVLFGDWQTCFQVYIDLFLLEPDSVKIRRAIEVMEYQMATPQNDYWWWADGLFMAMPVMTRLYKITGNEQYLSKLYDYYLFARDLMFDDESALFFRDAKYVYPKHKTNNGLKDFWARGNGWVFAAFPRVLEDLPQTNPHREEYLYIFRSMADAILKSQQPEGYWTRSMLDSEQAPGPETSGTAFFTYGMLWGINNGVLDESTYLPVVEKSWNYLINSALQPNGKLGYVQPIGERAIPGQMINIESTADFGVGAFLLAAAEMLRYSESKSIASDR